MASLDISIYSGRNNSRGSDNDVGVGVGNTREGPATGDASCISISSVREDVAMLNRIGDGVDFASERRLACSTAYFGLFAPPVVRARRRREVSRRLLSRKRDMRDLWPLPLAGVDVGGAFSPSLRFEKLDVRTMILRGEGGGIVFGIWIC